MKHKIVQKYHRQLKQQRAQQKRGIKKRTEQMKSDHQKGKRKFHKYINKFGHVTSKADRDNATHSVLSRLGYYCKKILEVFVIVFLNWSVLWFLGQSYSNIILLVSQNKISKGGYMVQIGILLLYALIFSSIAGFSFYWIVHFKWSYHKTREAKKRQIIDDIRTDTEYQKLIKKGLIHGKYKKY